MYFFFIIQIVWGLLPYHDTENLFWLTYTQMHKEAIVSVYTDPPSVHPRIAQNVATIVSLPEPNLSV